MKRSELEAKIAEIVDSGGWDRLEVEIDSCTLPDWKRKEEKVGLKVTMTKMYEFYDFQFKHFDALSKLFQTDQINLSNGDSSPGCSTCDYGSTYQTILEIFDSPITIEEDNVGDST